MRARREPRRFSFGYHLGIVNPALDNLARDLGIALNTQLKGLVVSRP